MNVESRTSFLLRSVVIAVVLGIAVGILWLAWLPGVITGLLFIGACLFVRALHGKVDRDFDRRFPADCGSKS
ncbi:MAG: hypothetical protein ACRDTD_23575 [Pseudonocardiaceae bacterium]